MALKSSGTILISTFLGNDQIHCTMLGGHTRGYIRDHVRGSCQGVGQASFKHFLLSTPLVTIIGQGQYVVDECSSILVSWYESCLYLTMLLPYSAKL